jgi:phospho-N-acetylmuramoyl-pentapeptide-transferase
MDSFLCFRWMIAGLLSLFCVTCFMPPFMRWIQKKGVQPIRKDGPPSHIHTKTRKPTMGGALFIPICVVISIMIMRPCPWMGIIATSTLLHGILGAMDDGLKITHQNTKGLSPSLKIKAQMGIALLILIWTYASLTPQCRFLNLPFCRPIPLNLFSFLCIGCVVMIGSCNAVNLTDGLDGLVVGPVLCSCIGLGIVSFFVGHETLSCVTHTSFVAKAQEITVFLASLAGCCLGFLWYNSYPSKIIMGDCGSMAIGGCLASVAIILRQEWFLAIVGILFVVEALSVTIQVIYFKATQKRFFLMAPIHHHFEKKGWTETHIVNRFWIVSIAFLLVSLLFFFGIQKCII